MCAQTLYIGSYTTQLGHVDGRGLGIYHMHFDPAQHLLQPAGVTGEIRNPSYLAHAPELGKIFAVEECSAEENPQIVAYAISPDRRLNRLNGQPAQGSAPCHVLVDPAERWLFVAHYGSGSVAVYPITRDGQLGQASTVVQHGGQGPDAARQEGPHAHGCTLDRSGRFLFVADLGIDRVMVYAFDSAVGSLSERPPGIVEPGAGPRHVVVHPNNHFVYVVNELNATVTCFTHDSGALTPLQTVSTRPDDVGGVVQPAALRMSRDGRFLYASNRIEENNIAGFAVHADSGHLTPLGHMATGGRTPRDFILTNSDEYLVVANQDSDSVTVLRIDKLNGALQPTGIAIETPSPAALLLV